MLKNVLCYHNAFLYITMTTTQHKTVLKNVLMIVGGYGAKDSVEECNIVV